MNEYELIYLAQEEKEGEARDNLYKEYEALLNLKARDYINLNGNQGIDINDIKLELKYVFEKAIDSYNQDNSASFKTFLITLINNFLKNYKRDNERLKNKFLNDSVSKCFEFQTFEKKIVVKIQTSFLFKNCIV